MKELILTQGKVALVDDEDFEELSKHKWSAHYGRGKWYAIRNCRKQIIYLHRQIMNTPSNLTVDHIDGDGLNCQKVNMRNCTQSQNMRNSSRKCGVKGVGKITGGSKYTAQIHVHGTKIHLGSFASLLEAAAAYNVAAVSLFGEFANLNDLQRIGGD